MTDQTATQVAHPWRATLRTTLAAAVAAVLTVALIVPVIWPIVVEELDRQGLAVPQQVTAVASTIVAIAAAITAITTRVMAIPEVDRLLGQIWLSAAPPTHAPRRALPSPDAQH